MTVPTPAERAIERIPDDRDNLQPGDITLLIVEDDPHYARVVREVHDDPGVVWVVLDNQQHGVAGLQVATVVQDRLDRAL